VKYHVNVEYGARRYGCKEAEVRQVMTTRINNIVKVEKAKRVSTCEQ
jgi:hypothetical protein